MDLIRINIPHLFLQHFCDFEIGFLHKDNIRIFLADHIHNRGRVWAECQHVVGHHLQRAGSCQRRLRFGQEESSKGEQK